MNYINGNAIIYKDTKKCRMYARPGQIIIINGNKYEITRIEGHDIYVRRFY